MKSEEGSTSRRSEENHHRYEESGIARPSFVEKLSCVSGLEWVQGGKREVPQGVAKKISVEKPSYE